MNSYFNFSAKCGPNKVYDLIQQLTANKPAAFKKAIKEMAIIVRKDKWMAKNDKFKKVLERYGTAYD